MNVQMNQFKQSQLKGQIDALINPTVFSVQIDPASLTAEFVAGDAMKLVNVDGNQIMVDKCAADEIAFGFLIFSPKKATYVPGDNAELAAAFSVIYAEASAAFDRGVQLEFVPTGTKVKENAGNPVCGVALDNAAGAGSLVRMLILNPYSVPATITSGSINGVAIGGDTPAAGTFTDLTASGVITLSGVLAGATPLVFEGSTANAFKGSLAVADFTADQTFTIPDATGTFDLHHQTPLVITAGATPSWTPGASRDLSTLTPGEHETIAAVVTGAVIGKRYTIKITTSGTDSFTLTFGANFKTTGTLATGTDDGKVFIIEFIFDGTNFVEVSRTTAM